MQLALRPSVKHGKRVNIHDKTFLHHGFTCGRLARSRWRSLALFLAAEVLRASGVLAHSPARVFQWDVEVRTCETRAVHL